MRRFTTDVVGFLSEYEQEQLTQLPAGCAGMKGLIMPRYIEGAISSVTLPSRLRLLGRQEFRLTAALNPIRIGNSVVGFAPTLFSQKEELVCTGCECCPFFRKLAWCWIRACCGGKSIHPQLYVLPFIFSRMMARIVVFVRVLLLLLFALLVVWLADVSSINVGKAWMIGTSVALFTIYKLSTYRKVPEGTRVFLRSLGAPAMEEYMFSYSWAVDAENIRTLARALWSAGVGVWIDVVKLCPGDEIRPMVRTTVARVQRVVVFLTAEYCRSANCCVEFFECVQHPKKLIICILNPIPQDVREFVEQYLVPNGSILCEGLVPLMHLLDQELQTMNDFEVIQWWRQQQLSGAGVPNYMVPYGWPIPRFSLWGRIFVPPKTVDVGPLYITGDCLETGRRFYPPYLLLLALISIGASVVDLYLKFTGDTPHTALDFVWLGAVCLCNVAPFFAGKELMETRRELHVSLRPLLSSRSFDGQGVKVRLRTGDVQDPVYLGLRDFLTDIGHLYDESNGSATTPTAASDATSSSSTSPSSSSSSSSSSQFPLQNISVYVINSLSFRDELFGGAGPLKFDKNALFVWSAMDEKQLPFTQDVAGQRMMRYLVLVAVWERNNLAASLFSALSVRVVDILQGKPARSEGKLNNNNAAPLAVDVMSP